LRGRRGGLVRGEDRVPDEAGCDDDPHQDPENQADPLRGVPRGRGGFYRGLCHVRGLLSWSRWASGSYGSEEAAGGAQSSQQSSSASAAANVWGTAQQTSPFQALMPSRTAITAMTSAALAS